MLWLYSNTPGGEKARKTVILLAQSLDVLVFINILFINTLEASDKLLQI